MLTLHRNKNGLKIIRWSSGNDYNKRRGFSIQTNGNLPLAHRAQPLASGALHIDDRLPVRYEFIEYVNQFGTERQKDIIRFF